MENVAGKQLPILVLFLASYIVLYVLLYGLSRLPSLALSTKERENRMPYNPKKIAEIEALYKDRHYAHVSCRLCDWVSNGKTLEEAIEENDKHEATHPETEEYQASLPDWEEVRGAWKR